MGGKQETQSPQLFVIKHGLCKLMDDNGNISLFHKLPPFSKKGGILSHLDRNPKSSRLTGHDPKRRTTKEKKREQASFIP